MSGDSDQNQAVIEGVCDDYQRKLLAGEEISITDYTKRHPAISEQIEAALTALRALHAESNSDFVPELVNGCRILGRIGCGGMGTVYEAAHPKITRRLAIKVLHKGLQATKEERQRFLREAEAVSRLSHENIVPLLDVGEDDGFLFLSMPCIAGVGLDRVLASTEHAVNNDHLATLSKVLPLPETGDIDFYRQVAITGATIASALQHAHDNGVIHRDVKPANLILDENRKIWVTDFGLAKLNNSPDDLSLANDMIGTPRYMAPEQFRGRADERSDIYSLGVTLYELVTGIRAWGSVDSQQMVDERQSLELQNPHELNSAVPRPLANIIMTACALHPQDRFQSADELCHVLLRYADGIVVPDRRNSRRIRSSRLFLRRSHLLMGIVTVFLAGSVVTWRGRHASELTSPPDVGVRTVEGAARQLNSIENSKSVGSVVPSMDRHQGMITWAITGGFDGHHFDVDRSNGELRFVSPPDFEQPQDFDADNRYQVQVLVSSSGYREELPVTICVANKNESPIIDHLSHDHDFVLNADSTVRGLPLSATDPEQDRLSWILSGRDCMCFQLHRLSGRVRLLSSTNLPPREYQFQLAATDRETPELQLVGVNTDQDRLVMISADYGKVVSTNIAASGFRAMATADGRTFFHVHTRPSGPAFFRTIRDTKGGYQTILLNANCDALKSVDALATEDGITFIARRADAKSRSLIKLTLVEGSQLVETGKIEAPAIYGSHHDFALLTERDAQLLAVYDDEVQISEASLSPDADRSPLLWRTMSIPPQVRILGIASWMEPGSEPGTTSEPRTISVTSP